MRRQGARWSRLPAKLARSIVERNGPESLAGLTATKAPKYGNETTIANGHGFDSKREAARYLELAMRQAAGEIRDLVCHPTYDLHSCKPTICIGRFTPDFRYVEVATGEVIAEDVKSKPTRTTAYMLRKRLFEAEYGIPLRETY